MNTKLQRLLIDNYGDDLFHQYGRRTRRLRSQYGQISCDAEGEEQQLIDEGTAAGFVMYCVCRDRTECSQDSDDRYFHCEWLARRLGQYTAIVKAAWMLSVEPSSLSELITKLAASLNGVANLELKAADVAPVRMNGQTTLVDEMKKRLGECPNPNANTIEESLTEYIRESIEDCRRISRQEYSRSDLIRRKLALHKRAIEICEIDLSECFVLHEAMVDLKIMRDRHLCKDPTYLSLA